MKIPFESILESKKSDIFYIVELCLKYFKIKFTKKNLNDLIITHGNYPSLLTLKDTLDAYGIETLATRKKGFCYHEIELPFITVIQKEDWSEPSFTLITHCSESHITYFDVQNNGFTTIKLKDFEKIDKGVVLFLDTINIKHEENFGINKKNIFFNNLYSKILLICFLLFSTVALISSGSSFVGVIFYFTSFLGFIFSAMLLLFDIDRFNPIIREVCGRSKEIEGSINCNAVLNSNYSSFLGISWSIWGFSFFSTFLLSFIFQSYENIRLYENILTIISCIISPYILYSIFYQKYKIGHWCPLCLAILIILFVNFVVALYELKNGHLIELSKLLLPFLRFIFLGILILLITNFILPFIKVAKESKDLKRLLNSFKQNPEVLKSILRNQDKLPEIPIDVGITIGNPKAKNEIIKFCNPYCKPCSMAHLELKKIIRKYDNIKLRIIFTATGKIDDIRTPPVLHFLSIYKYGEHKTIEDSLDFWYQQTSKDFNALKLEYPLEIKKQDIPKLTKDIVLMRYWVDKLKVRVTPSIYVNGYALPLEYELNDLNYYFEEY